MASFVDKQMDSSGNLVAPAEDEALNLENHPAIYTEAGRGTRKRLELKKKLEKRRKEEAEKNGKSKEELEAEAAKKKEAAELAKQKIKELEEEARKAKEPEKPKAKVKVGNKMMVNTAGTQLSAAEQARIGALCGSGKAGKVKAWTNMDGEKKEITAEDLASDEVAVFTKCKNCEFHINTLCTKVFVTQCEDFKLFLNGKIVTATVEVDRVERANFVVNCKIGTFQIEQCKKVNVVYVDKSHFHGYLIWAGCFLLRVQVGNDPESCDLMRCDFGLTAKFDKTVNVERTQFKVWYDKLGKLVCDKIIRLRNGFPSTARENAEYERKREMDVSSLADRMGITISRKKELIGNKIKPNERCPCGSGKKYKKCCRC